MPHTTATLSSSQSSTRTCTPPDSGLREPTVAALSTRSKLPSSRSNLNNDHFIFYKQRPSLLSTYLLMTFWQNFSICCLEAKGGNSSFKKMAAPCTTQKTSEALTAKILQFHPFFLLEFNIAQHHIQSGRSSTVKTKKSKPPDHSFLERNICPHQMALPYDFRRADEHPHPQQQSSHILQIQQLLRMAEEKDPLSSGSLTLSGSNSKTEVEMRRDKKKKLAAFKTFLDNKNDHSPLEDLPARRKLSENEMQEEKLETNETCKICREPQAQPRTCEFCRDSVCLSHMRKRRRNPDTNKWTRICEYCEDKYLMEKHYQNEMKTEESLLSQEAVIRSKHTEMAEAIAGKRVKLQMLNNKRADLIEHTKKENNRLTVLQTDIDKRTKKLQTGLRQTGNLELSLMSLEKSLPPSLQADYEFLQQQNSRITSDLVRYEKLCIEAVKTRSQREKQMYQEYYEWEEKRREELEASEKKEEQCTIY